MAKCEYCGEEVTMPYTCGYCGGSFCSKHRLPENHECKGLDDLSEESRRKGYIYRGISEDLEEKPQEEPSDNFENIRVSFGGGGPRGMRDPKEKFSGSSGLSGLIKNLFFSSTTNILIFVMVLVFISQLIAWSFGYFDEVFVRFLLPKLNSILYKPWTLITSIFVHADFRHLFLNGLILFFIGPSLERRIGRKRFIYAFLGAGIIASIAQLLVIEPGFTVLGASGAIFGILATLTVISPRMPILLFFFLPMQLWMLTLGYGILETIWAIQNTGGTVGHMAHVAGLAVGLIYGYKLRREGFGSRGSSIEELFKRFGA